MTGKEVLRAIADGADPNEFEMVRGESFYEVHADWQIGDFLCSVAEFRRKLRTRVVNGFTVPAPMDKPPGNMSTYFLATPETEEWFDEYEWDESNADRLWIRRNLLFSTKEAAIANAKAMVGINPESEA